MPTKKEFINSLKPFRIEQYKDIDRDKLTVYSVGILTKNNIEPLFENIVVVLFKLFPEIFSLIGYNEYPDSKLVRDCLFHCTYKTKGWLLGSSKEGWGGKSGFFITEKGKNIFEETEKILSGELIPRIVKSKTDMKVDMKQKSIINDIKSSDVYQLFNINKVDKISDYDIKRVLRGTRTTPIPKLLNNYNRLRGYAEDLQDEEFIKFLDFIIIRLKKIKG